MLEEEVDQTNIPEPVQEQEVVVEVEVVYFVPTPQQKKKRQMLLIIEEEVVLRQTHIIRGTVIVEVVNEYLQQDTLLRADITLLEELNTNVTDTAYIALLLTEL